MELKGSRTEQNLIAAFAGESEARNKYTYYAAKAREDGYEQIADLFQETADNEKAHAKLWFEQLHGIHTTEENLKDAAAGEHFEWSEMYATFAEEAKEEGFDRLSSLFKLVAKVEKEHEERYLKLLENGVLQGRRCRLGMQELRSCPYRKDSSGCLPGMRLSPGIF